MHKFFEIITVTRNNLILLIDSVTIDQINEIPEGFNNNLAWQLGHVIAVQQGIAYVRSGNKPLIETALLEKYKNGTKPEGFISAEEFDLLKQLSVSTLLQFEKDFAAGAFNNYSKFILPTGVEITSIHDGLYMLLMHEGMHFGYAQALKRALKF